PLDYNISTGSPEGFGFTLPLTALSIAAAQGPQGLAAAAPGLIANAFTPRSQTGLSLQGPSPSTMGVLHSLSMIAVQRNAGSISDAVASNLRFNFDLTLVSPATRNRSETRAQLMDINGDGLPDYVLYNSGKLITGIPAGSMIAYLNSSSGFSDPVVINQ